MITETPDHSRLQKLFRGLPGPFRDGIDHTDEGKILREVCYKIDIGRDSNAEFHGFLEKKAEQLPETRALFIALNEGNYHRVGVILQKRLVNGTCEFAMFVTLGARVPHKQEDITYLELRYRPEGVKKIVHFHVGSKKATPPIEVPPNFADYVNSLEDENLMREARNFSAAVNLPEYVGLGLLEYYRVLVDLHRLFLDPSENGHFNSS